MRLAIHHRKGSFSERWIEFCERHGILFKLVDCLGTTIMKDLEGCSGLMWHWNHSDTAAAKCARQLTMALETRGMPVFPSSAASWHYDDKIGQKYLLESVNAPLVPTYVFYDEVSALDWAATTTYPKVFKLTSGAGSADVRLIGNFHQATKIIRRMFTRGMRSRMYRQALRDRTNALLRGRNSTSARHLLNGAWKALRSPKTLTSLPRESGYVYFQDFIPGSDYDIRVIVIGDRAFAIRRLVRKNDFRASGSGLILSQKSDIPEECVSLAFEISDRLASECVAYDYIYNDSTPLLIEVSYAFNPAGYVDCDGYWDRRMEWHSGRFLPQDFMIRDFIQKLGISNEGLLELKTQ